MLKQSFWGAFLAPKNLFRTGAEILRCAQNDRLSSSLHTSSPLSEVDMLETASH